MEQYGGADISTKRTLEDVFMCEAVIFQHAGGGHDGGVGSREGGVLHLH